MQRAREPQGLSYPTPRTVRMKLEKQAAEVRYLCGVTRLRTSKKQISRDLNRNINILRG